MLNSFAFLAVLLAITLVVGRGLAFLDAMRPPDREWWQQ
jgi:hypothetical protein